MHLVSTYELKKATLVNLSLLCNIIYINKQISHVIFNIRQWVGCDGIHLFIFSFFSYYIKKKKNMLSIGTVYPRCGHHDSHFEYKEDLFEWEEASKLNVKGHIKDSERNV